MKKKMLTLTLIVFMAGTILNSCQSSAKKVENTGSNMIQTTDSAINTKVKLTGIDQDSITDYKQFKITSEKIINEYDKKITKIKSKIANEKLKNKANYEKKLAELEQKNNDLKKMLADYKEEGMDQWVSFKTKFNQKMSDLGKALKAFTVSD